MRVLTMPGFGAFPMMTRARIRWERDIAAWLRDCMRDRKSLRSRRARPTTSKIIEHDPAQDKPRCSQRPFQRTADFRLSNSWVVAHRHFDDAKSRDVTLQDHFHCP